MRKENCRTIKLDKGEINLYDFSSVKLYAYKTNDYIDDEVFILEGITMLFVLNYHVFMIISKN